VRGGLEARLHAGYGNGHGEVRRARVAGQVQHPRLGRVHRHATNVFVRAAAQVGGPQHTRGGGVERLQVNVGIGAAGGLAADRIAGHRQVAAVGRKGQVDVLLRVNPQALGRLEQWLLEDDAGVGFHLDDEVILSRAACRRGAQLQRGDVKGAVRPRDHAGGSNGVDLMLGREYRVGLEQHQVGHWQPVRRQGEQVQLHVAEAGRCSSIDVERELVRHDQYIGRAVRAERETRAAAVRILARLRGAGDDVPILLPALRVVLGPEGVRIACFGHHLGAQV